MPKVIKGNLNDAANKILQGISIETKKILKRKKKTQKRREKILMRLNSSMNF